MSNPGTFNTAKEYGPNPEPFIVAIIVVAATFIGAACYVTLGKALKVIFGGGKQVSENIGRRVMSRESASAV